MIKSLFATTALGLFVAQSANANLVTNGGFELPVVNRGAYSIVSSIAGWTGSPDIEIQNHAAGSPFAGDNLVELDGNFNSAMYQDITTVAGQRYVISFVYSARPGVAASSNGIDFLWNNLLIQSIAQSGLNLADTAWTTFTYSLLAIGTTSRIGFAATGTSDSYGGYLDNVSANALVGTAAIPEPATMSLLGAGLLFAALATRRRCRAH